MTLAMLFASAAISTGCTHPPLNAARRAAMSEVISRQLGRPVRPSEISDVMEAGHWRLVWATPADAERGVFFLRGGERTGWRYVDLWGGVITPDERNATIQWARHRGPDLSPALARCFTDALLDGK